jgi:hypothetical protein
VESLLGNGGIIPQISLSAAIPLGQCGGGFIPPPQIEASEASKSEKIRLEPAFLAHFFW